MFLGFARLSLTILIFISSFALAERPLTISRTTLPSSLLDSYGFTTAEQKEAFKSLLRLASTNLDIIDCESETHCLSTEPEFADRILTLLTETQEKFVVRKEKQERWEVVAPNWMNKQPEIILRHLNTLGFTYLIAPREREFDAICILGATAPRMKERVEYAQGLLANDIQTKNIILLTGERYVKAGIDGPEDTLTALAQKYNLPNVSALTETHMLREIFETSPLSREGIKTYVIDTPAGELPRPTTQTTVEYLLDWLKSHQAINNILFVTNQPYVKYQEAIIRTVLEAKRSNLGYQVVGPAATTDQIKPLLEALGSYIWAQTPEVLKKLTTILNKPVVNNELRALYAKNPLLYKQLPESSCQANTE